VRVSKPLIRTLVVAFVVLDVALGVLAWRHVTGGESTAATAGGTAGTSTDNPDVFIPNPGTSQGTDNFQTQDLASATLFDASSEDVIVATTGTCDGTAPTVLVSDDGGKNLAPVKPDVSRVLAVSVQTDGTLKIVGADDDCEAIGLTSDDGGATWDTSTIGTGWYRDPESPTGLVAANTPTDVGCQVMSVSDLSASVARVSCDDGTVRATDDAGTSWTTVGGLTAVRALDFRSNASGVALVQTDDCAVSAFLTVDGGDTWEQRGCADGQVGRAVLDQGNRFLATVDATVSESTDGGLTWKAANGG
jgi:hypothetical protein